MLQPQKERERKEAQAAEGQVYPENPTPTGFLGQSAADQGTGDRAECPRQALETEPLAALTQRDEVGDEDLGQRDDAAAADTLDAATD